MRQRTPQEIQEEIHARMVLTWVLIAVALIALYLPALFLRALK